MVQKYTDILNADDFNAGITETDLALITGKDNLIGYYQVPAHQLVCFGAGAITGGVETRQFIKIRMDSAVGEIKGTYKFVMTDSHKGRKQFVMSQRSENLSGGATVRLGEVEKDITTWWGKEDSYLEIYFDPDSSTTLDYSDTNNVILMPITRQLL